MTSCPSPLSFETLTDYWAKTLSAQDAAAVDEHLFGCGHCTDRSGQVAALVRALARTLPVVISRGRLEQLEQQGARLRHTPVEPGERATVVFAAGVDYLIHHLRAPLSDVRRVDCQLLSRDGLLIAEHAHLPFDRERGEVIIACQRHYLAVGGPDTLFRVTTFDQTGASLVREYGVFHVIEG
jgi:Putative zinc-finger